MLTTEDIATTTETTSHFLTSSTPLWLGLTSAFAAIASVLVAAYVARRQVILTSPQIELSIAEDQPFDGTIKITITNHGQASARQLNIVWDFDPLHTRTEAEQWATPLLKESESITASITLNSPGYPTESALAVCAPYRKLANPELLTSYGILRYRSVGSLFFASKRKVQLPSAERFWTLFEERESHLRDARDNPSA